MKLEPLTRFYLSLLASERQEVQSDMENDENFYILALDGGGARGIYPARILDRLKRRLSKSVTSASISSPAQAHSPGQLSGDIGRGAFDGG